VNIWPDEANRLIDGLMLPVSLKAGMIGNLQIKVSYLSITILIINKMFNECMDNDLWYSSVWLTCGKTP